MVTQKEKKKNKMLLIFHEVFVKYINAYTKEDFENYQIKTRTQGSFVKDLLEVDTVFNNKLAELMQVEPEELSIFDKAICFGMSFKKTEPIIVMGTNYHSPQRFKNVNAKMTAEAMMYYLDKTKYRIAKPKKKTICGGDFSFEGFEDGHKLELAKLKKELIEASTGKNVNYLVALDILKKMYIKGIIYGNGLDGISEEEFLSLLTVYETYDVRCSVNKTSDAYKEAFQNRLFIK